MVTIFTTPKAFRGHIDVIQRNSLASWIRLFPGEDILLIGDDDGVGEAAREFGCRHFPEVRRNESGTPLISSIFGIGAQNAKNDVLCYVNTDIILLDEFKESLDLVIRRKRKFMMVGQRWDVDVTEPLIFGPGWQDAFRAWAHETGKPYRPGGMDYFAYSRNALPAIPDFAIGRTVWDNWLPYGARKQNAALVDATGGVLVIHQNHDYRHASQAADGELAVWTGPEAMENARLAGSPNNHFTVADATHALSRQNEKLVLRRKFSWRHMQTLPALRPELMPVWQFGFAMLKIARVAAGAIRGRRVGPGTN